MAHDGLYWCEFVVLPSGLVSSGPLLVCRSLRAATARVGNCGRMRLYPLQFSYERRLH